MDIRSYRRSLIEATKFLLSQQNHDGSFNPVEHGVTTYHKVPYALSVMGQLERASRLSMHISESVIDAEGDFVGPFSRSDLLQEYYILPNAWLICGAQRLGQFAVSLRGVDFISTLQHPETGGFFTAGPEATISGEQDILSTATAGLALLYCGRVDEAMLAGEYLEFMLDNQPSSAARMFLKSKGQNELIAEFEEENAQKRVVQLGQSDQWYHAPALASGVLTKLAQLTGKSKRLQKAQDYLHFIDSCASDRYSSERSGFFGWAAALLYGATGNTNYRRIATSVADGLLDGQLDNGSWLKASMGEDITADVVDATAENMICMMQILEGLSTGE